MTFVPAIQNDLAPRDSGYGDAWYVCNYLDATDVRFRGTFADCERWLEASKPGDASGE